MKKNPTKFYDVYVAIECFTCDGLVYYKQFGKKKNNKFCKENICDMCLKEKRGRSIEKTKRYRREYSRRRRLAIRG